MVLAWQAGTYDWGTMWTQGDNSFWDIFDVIVNGALVNLIVCSAPIPSFCLVTISH